MKRPNFDLPSIVSSGPKVLRLDNGTTFTQATPCGRCGAEISEGDVISKTFHGWQHQRCSKDTLANVPPSRAWLALAMDAARRPRDFKATQLRAILEAVVDIAFGAEQDEHEAYTEALSYAYEKMVEATQDGHGVVVDPHQFASRYAEFEWARPEWGEARLPVELAYIEACGPAAERDKPRNWNVVRMATAAMGGPETPENRKRAEAWVDELVTDALGPDGA